MRARRGIRLPFALAILLATTAPARADDLEAQREKFEIGVAHFRAGRFAQAIAVWEPVLKALGETTGYRLLYNLGVAYDEIGDATNAVDRLKRFLRQLAARTGDVPPEVRDYEIDAKKRLERLDAAYARIRFATDEVPPLSLRIDGVARTEAIAEPVYYVAPGRHEVVLHPGAPDEERRTVDVAAGRETTITKAPRAAPTLAPAASSAPPPALPQAPAPSPGPPFSPVWIAVAGGATLAAIGAAIYVHEDARGWRADAEDPSLPVADRLAAQQTFANRKTWYEATLTGAGVLAAGTGALATWYLLATPKGESAAVRISPNGVSLVGRF